MRKYEERAVEETREVLVLRTCDWCDLSLETETEVSEKRLTNDIARDQDFTCEFITCSGTGIYLTGEGWEIDDLCIDCVGRLRSLLESEGIKISKRTF